MNIQDEERFLAECISDAKAKVREAEKAKREAGWALDKAKIHLELSLQNAMDYMKGNGLLECDAFKIRKSYRVNVESIGAVPEEYQRVKTTIEPDKVKIKANKPSGNWYIIEENESVEIK